MLITYITYSEFIQTTRLFAHENNRLYYTDLSKKTGWQIEDLKQLLKFGKNRGAISFKNNITYFKPIKEITDEEWGELITYIETIPYPKNELPIFYKIYEKELK